MKKNLRILMLNYEFPPLGGGAGNANLYLLKEFKKFNNLNIDLITSSTDKFKMKKFSKNINIFYLDIRKNSNSLHYQTTKDLLCYFLKSYYFAKRLIKKNNYDLIHAWFGIPCGFIALLLKKPYIVALRGSDVPFYNPRFKILDKLFFKQLSKIVWKNAKKVITNSEGLKELALKTSPHQKIEIIYNGVDITEFKPLPKRKTTEALKILCVARLIRRKGIHYLIKALGKLKKYNFILNIIGEGNEKENLKKLANNLGISKKVNFLGLIPHNQIVKYYQQSDVFVLPSLNEGMSNTILEAMSCGLPIITTEVGGAKELVTENNGFIIKPKSIFQLKKMILKYLKNPKLIKIHGQNSRKIAKKMSWKKVAKKYYQAYFDALNYES